MRKLFFSISLVFTIFFCITTLTSCDEEGFVNRRGVYKFSEINANFSVDVDWMTDFGSLPTGMSVFTYGENTGVKSEITNSVNTIDLKRPVDNYRLLIFNLTPDEFSTLTFHNTQNIDSFYVKLKPLTQYMNGKWDQGVEYMCAPEPFAFAYDTIAITKDMVESSYCKAFQTEDCDECSDSIVYVYKEKPQPMAIKLEIRIRTNGITNLKKLAGSLSGLADGYMPGVQHNTTESGIYLLDDWKITLDSVGATNGWVSTVVTTFGLPHGTEDVAERDSSLNRLTLNYTLRDRSTLTLSFCVGDMFSYEEDTRAITIPTLHNLELIINTDIDENDPSGEEKPRPRFIIPKLPDVIPVDDDDDGSGSGFDADVDKWEEGGNIDIGL